MVLEVEGAQAYSHRNDDERPESLHQRYACGLDGCQLRAFTQITEGDKCRQKNSQRQSLRNKHQGHIPEELCHDFHGQSLTNKVVDISPQELHHQHELADEEGSHKEKTKLLGYENI